MKILMERERETNLQVWFNVPDGDTAKVKLMYP